MNDRDRALWKRIGQTIRATRRSQKLSVGTLASRVNVDRTQIVRLEAGGGGTTLPRLVAIADALGVRVEDLISNATAATDTSQTLAFRGHHLTPEEVEKVLDYIEYLEHRRSR